MCENYCKSLKISEVRISAAGTKLPNMNDPACNYLNHFTLLQPTSVLQQQQQSQLPSQKDDDNALIFSCNSNEFPLSTLYTKQNTASTEPTSHQAVPPMKMEVQYPPLTSSTGSASLNSSISQSAASSASVSPSIFPSSAQSFASVSVSPLALSGSSSTSSSSVTVAAAADLSVAAVASAAYGWNAATYTSLPTRTQFPYSQYATDYYGNVATVGVAASASAAWFSHQERLYQPWSAKSYPSINYDDIAFQTQLQRRSVRCTCPNCTNEMSGLPPIVGPDERGRKQHMCHIPGCERLYGKASHLKTHLRWHTGERPFLCLTCGKRFSRSDELQRHGRTHTNYRPYACPICSKKFSRSDHLSKHKKTHFKDKKIKKALLAEAKGQSASIKQEKSDKTLHTKKIIKSITLETVMPTSREQLKPEHLEASSRLGYAPYMNPYQQSAAVTAISTDLSVQPPPLLQPQQLSDSPGTFNGNRSRCSLWNNISNNNNFDLDQNQITSASVRPISARSVAIFNSSSNSSQTQHYAALAMQSESQLATEYGLTMSGYASGASDSNSSRSSNNAALYANHLGPIKSEYAPNYLTEVANSSGYGFTHHHVPHTHAHYHHHHNEWAAAYHPHATA